MANAFMPFYTGDYLRKTRRLKAPEHGAYILLLIALWDEGGALPYDESELREIARCSTRTWPKIWAKLKPFFIISEGQISHQKVTDTLADVSEKRRSYVARGKKGGTNSAKKRKENKDAAEAQLQQSSSNQPKGLDNPKGLYPTLPPDGALALEELRAAAGTGHEISDIEKLKTCITGWRDGAFLVNGQYALEKLGQSLRPVLLKAGVRLELPTTPAPAQFKLHAVNSDPVS